MSDVECVGIFGDYAVVLIRPDIWQIYKQGKHIEGEDYEFNRYDGHDGKTLVFYTSVESAINRAKTLNDKDLN